MTTVRRKDGTEQFHAAGASLGFRLVDFWSWAHSDLVCNALRGSLAEYLVGRALGVTETCLRIEWDAFDLTAPSGHKVEVKSAAYVQSWPQKKPSLIKFDIPPTLGWSSATNTNATVAARQADVYVFAVLHHQVRDTLDPLDLTHWEFYVLATSVLNERCPTQKSIALAALLRLGARKVAYKELAAVVAGVELVATPRLPAVEASANQKLDPTSSALSRENDPSDRDNACTAASRRETD